MNDERAGHSARSPQPGKYRACLGVLLHAQGQFRAWFLASLFVPWPLIHSVPQNCWTPLTLDSGVEARKIIIKCVISVVKNTLKKTGWGAPLNKRDGKAFQRGDFPEEQEGLQHKLVEVDPGKRVPHMRFSAALGHRSSVLWLSLRK